MPGKYTSSEEKARILAWRQEKVSIKEICACSGRAKSTVMNLLTSAKGLPPNKVPKHRFGGGRKKEDIKCDGQFNEEGGAEKSTTDSPGAKKFASRTAGKCCSAHNAASPAKRLGLA